MLVIRKHLRSLALGLRLTLPPPALRKAWRARFEQVFVLRGGEWLCRGAMSSLERIPFMNGGCGA